MIYVVNFLRLPDRGLERYVIVNDEIIRLVIGITSFVSPHENLHVNSNRIGATKGIVAITTQIINTTVSNI